MHLKERDHLEDVGVDGKITLEWILRKRWEDVDWMHLVQDTDQWRALVSTVISLLCSQEPWFHKRRRIS